MQGKRLSKADLLRTLKNYSLITLGCAILAFGTVAFLLPFDLITGGISGIAVIFNHYWGHLVEGGIEDIVTWVFEILLLLVSFLFLGVKYSVHTIFASIVYPLFFSIFLRTGCFDFISKAMLSVENEQYAMLILAGIFGGAITGAGVAVTYLGGGSTGGFDILASTIAKYTPVKEGTSTFFIDGSIVLAGMICLRDIPKGLIGILGAFACAIALQFIYVNSSVYVIADIISDRYEEILEYVHVKMERGATILDATGTYTGMDRKVLRVAFHKKELNSFRDFIAKTDPNAFVTFQQASMINGNGFDSFQVRRKRKKAKKDQEKGEKAK